MSRQKSVRQESIALAENFKKSISQQCQELQDFKTSHSNLNNLNNFSESSQNDVFEVTTENSSEPIFVGWVDFLGRNATKKN